MSQTIIRAHTENISLYNMSDTAYFADSGASKDMLPDYYNFKKHRRLYNRYATLGNTTNLPIEGTVTAVYTLNGQTILACKALHITALHGPLYYLSKQSQRPGCGVYYLYKYGSQLFFPYFILQEEESYDNIVSYPSIGKSHQGTIDYIEPKYTCSTNRDIPYVQPYMVTPADKIPLPHIILSYEYSISSEPPLHITSTSTSTSTSTYNWGLNH